MNLLVELKELRSALLSDDEAATLAYNRQRQEQAEVQRAVEHAVGATMHREEMLRQAELELRAQAAANQQHEVELRQAAGQMAQAARNREVELQQAAIEAAKSS